MAEETGISWADSTVNFWLGCHKVGPGCDNCYAKAMMDDRYGRAKWGATTERVRTAPSTWRQPLTWQRGAAKFREKHGRNRSVFVNSLSDIFDNQAPDAWRAEIWDIVDACPDLNWIFVTKRIGNAMRMLPDRWLGVGGKANLIVLATVVTQAEWAHALRNLDVLTRHLMGGLSMEPLLEPVELGAAAAFLDWVIVGGESRQSRVPGRHMPAEWMYGLQCETSGLGIPYHAKQMSNGAPIPPSLDVKQWPKGWRDV